MEANQGRKLPNFWLVVGILVIAELTCAFESSMVNVSLAKLYGIYGDPIHVSWMLTAFSLTAAATVAISSRLGDLYGRVSLLAIMLALALVGSIISFLSHDLNMIILGRAVQGSSMAILPLGFGILRELVPPREVDIGVGILGGTYSFGTGFGLIVGGMIVDHTFWQNVFIASGGVALLGLILTLVFLPRTPGRGSDKPLDIAGGLLLMVPITAFLLGLTFGAKLGWNALSIGLVLGGVAGLAAWTIFELRHPFPLIDVRQLKNRQIAAVNAAIFFASMGPIIYTQVVIPLLQQPLWTGVGLGLAATAAGLIKMPANLVSAATTVGSGYLARKISMRNVIIGATMFNLLAWVLLTVKHDSVWFIAAILILLIVPMLTVMFCCAPALIIAAAPADRTSEATGLSSVIRAVAMAIGSQMLGMTLATSSIVNDAGERFPDSHAYTVTFAALTICSLISLGFAFLVPKTAKGAGLTQETAPTMTPQLAASEAGG